MLEGNPIHSKLVVNSTRLRWFSLFFLARISILTRVKTIQFSMRVENLLLKFKEVY